MTKKRKPKKRVASKPPELVPWDQEQPEDPEDRAEEDEDRYVALVKAWREATAGQTPGETGPCAMRWVDGMLFAVQADTGLVVGVSTQEWAECLWLPPEVLPLVVKAAKRAIRQRAEKRETTEDCS